MKKFLVIFLMFLSASFSLGETLSGSVSYDVNSAREEAFSNPDYTFSPDMIASHLTDNSFTENMNALLTGKTELKDRTICKFSTGIYGIRYNDDPYRAYYYSSNGKLDYVDKKSRLEYPHKVYTYDLNGELIGTALYVSKYEQYIFNSDKKLTTHWVGNKGFDKSGALIKTRVYTD